MACRHPARCHGHAGQARGNPPQGAAKPPAGGHVNYDIRNFTIFCKNFPSPARQTGSTHDGVNTSCGLPRAGVSLSPACRITGPRRPGGSSASDRAVSRQAPSGPARRQGPPPAAHGCPVGLPVQAWSVRNHAVWAAASPGRRPPSRWPTRPTARRRSSIGNRSVGNGGSWGHLDGELGTPPAYGALIAPGVGMRPKRCRSSPTRAGPSPGGQLHLDHPANHKEFAFALQPVGHEAIVKKDLGQGNVRAQDVVPEFAGAVAAAGE